MAAPRGPTSQWEALLEALPPSEHEELRAQIGRALIDELEMVQQEVRMLLEIWQEYRSETDTLTQPHINTETACLPEPPMVRDRLTQELKFLAEQLRQTSLNDSLDEDQVVAYALRTTNTQGSARPHSSPAKTQRPQTARPGSGDGTLPLRGLSADHCRDHPVTLTSAVDLDRRGATLEALRQALRKEVDGLKEDSEFLRNCLDGEADHRHELLAASNVYQPSLQELREARKRLEHKFVHESATTRAALSASPNLPSATAASSDPLPPPMSKAPLPLPLAAPASLPRVSRPPPLGAALDRQLPMRPTSENHKQLPRPPPRGPLDARAPSAPRTRPGARRTVVRSASTQDSTLRPLRRLPSSHVTTSS